MKIIFPLLASAAAVHANQQSLDVILAAFASVANWTQGLTETLNTFEGIQQAGPLLAANQGTLTAVQNATTNVSMVEPISPLDALQLAAPTINLVTMVNASIESIIKKKPVFVESKLGQVVLSSLYTLGCASDQFSNTTISKLPGGGITIASEQLAAPIPVSFQKGIAAYIDQAANGSTPPPCQPVSSVNPNAPNPPPINGASLLSTNSFSAIALAVLTVAFML